MAVLSADLHQGVNSLWDTQGIDWTFKTLWAEDLRDSFASLNDQEAPPGQPFPHCIFEQSTGVTVSRMTGHDKDERHEIRDIPWSFRIQVRQIEGLNETSKKIAADLAESVMALYGGHPTIVPKKIPLDGGDVLLTQYQTDFGVITGDEEYSWTVSYIIRVDYPVAL